MDIIMRRARIDMTGGETHAQRNTPEQPCQLAEG